VVLHLAKNSLRNFNISEIEVEDTWTDGDRGNSGSDEELTEQIGRCNIPTLTRYSRRVRASVSGLSKQY